MSDSCDAVESIGATFWMEEALIPSKYLSDFAVNLLIKCKSIEKPRDVVKIKDFMQKSIEFPIEFGTNTCRVQSQPEERHPIIESQHIPSAYPVIHERVLFLYLAFLEHKMNFGSNIEKEIYRNIGITEFVQRLLTKRCVTFVGVQDHYTLLSKDEGFGRFEEVGTSKERAPLVLENVLNYNEMKLSAFLSVSTYTDFLNDGERENKGRIEEDKTKFTQDGIVIGVIGPRFQRPDVMDCEDCLITKAQNVTSRGYGRYWIEMFNGKAQDYRRVWNEFYEESSLLYNDVWKKREDDKRFCKHQRNQEILFVDCVVLKKRYTVSFDTLLLEADSRAEREKRQAYLHVVGFGLGVWKAVANQENIFLETFIERLKMFLEAGKLRNIAVVDFSYIYSVEWQQRFKDVNGFLKSENHPNGGIRIFLSKRSFAARLPTEYEDHLLIVSFAWDSNALPGNEFWLKCLRNSSDSTTASNTLITELMNPYINTTFVNGNNLHIATMDHGVLHIKDYCEKILKLF